MNKRLKTVIWVLLAIAAVSLAVFLCSCRNGDEPVDDPNGTQTVESLSPKAEETPEPAQLPEIVSAVDFLNLPVISNAAADAKTTNDPDSLKPGEHYVGGTPNDRKCRYDLLKLDKEQSRKILAASDLTGISYHQSECLPIMLSWDDVSVLDMYRYSQNYEGYAFRAYYYYLEDSTVIIVNDALRTLVANKNYGKAWILVIPKADEDQYAGWIPPKGTVVSRTDENASLYEPYYDCIRNYFKNDPELPARAENLEPVYESYMTDYAEWMKWRGEHPDYYEAWKALSYPSKELAEDHSATAAFRIGTLAWCESFRKDGEAQAPTEEDLSADLPGVYFQIKRYGVPKEEMLEYVKWMKWSGNFDRLSISEEHVEALYSEDEALIRQSLLAGSAVCLDGKVYRQYDIINWLPAYDLARIFTKEEFFARYPDFANGWIDREGPQESVTRRVNRVNGAWDEYEKISKEDSGALDTVSAARVLNDFMEFYKEVRYSPDAIAGELASNYDPEYFNQDDYFKTLHLSNKSFPELREEMYNVFTSDLCKRLNANGDGYYTVFYSNQFGYLLQDGFPNQYLVTDLAKYYNGQIELYDDDYRLEDHIVINSSDETSAAATLTARDRDGMGESQYSVEFTKVGGRWLISGGTVFELVETGDSVKEWK